MNSGDKNIIVDSEEDAQDKDNENLEEDYLS